MAYSDTQIFNNWTTPFDMKKAQNNTFDATKAYATSGLDSNGNVPLTSQPKVETKKMTGLALEHETKPVATTKQTSVQSKAQVKEGPTMDEQTRKWFGISKEDWNKLGEEEKQKRTDVALGGMIESYNKTHKNKMTVAQQYALYSSRCQSKEEVIRLTRTVKSMDTDNQLTAFKSSYKYKNAEYRDAAEKILAVDYTKLDEKNVPEAAKETRNFSEENQVIAAQHSSEAPVKVQEAVTKEFTSRKNEKIDLALSDNIGNYGVEKDGKVNTEVQEHIATDLLKTPFQSVTENVSRNVYTLDERVQIPVSKNIMGMDNEGAQIALASTYNKFKGENQKELNNMLSSSKYESVHYELKQQETAKIEETQTTKTENTENTVNTEETDNKAKSEKKVSDVVKLATENKNDKVVAAKVKTLTDSEKLRLLEQCPTESVVLAILNSNPSTEVLRKIDGKVLAQVKDKKDLSTQMAFLGSEAQSLVLAQKASSGRLGDINRAFLTSSLKKRYDEYKQENSNKVA